MLIFWDEPKRLANLAKHGFSILLTRNERNLLT